MSKENIKVTFYYGDEAFDKIMGKIIMQKLSYYSIMRENKCTICRSKDDGTTAIYQKIKE